MIENRRVSARLWIPLAAALCLIGVPGCYKPNIADNGLTCAPGGVCPSGFACISGLCAKGAHSDASVTNHDVRPDVPDGNVDLLPDLVKKDATPDMTGSCNTPVSGCTPQSTGACDPVCQTSCACLEKCSVSNTGALACVGLLGQRQTGESCSIDSFGSDKQRDDCLPGNVCLRPGGQGSMPSYCFALCLNDGQCPGVPCVKRQVALASATSTPTAQVCDLPFVMCDPFSPESANGCPADRPFCYLAAPDSKTGISRTVCEYATGGAARTNACSYSRDCFPGLVCPTGVAGAGFCSIPCDATHACTGGTCRAYGGTYGFCN